MKIYTLKKIYFLLALFISISFISIAQNATKISGRILNNKNEGLPGVSISIEGLAGGISTDVEGNFTLAVPAGKEVTLKITAVGYQAKTLTQVTGNTEELNVILEQASKNLEDVTVKASSVRRETVNALIAYQKNTSTVSQVISAEAIRRSPDRNTGEVLKRIPGTSIQEGKYLVVRGLSDRYNQAMLNGTLLSSTEPDRKTFSFDIFPSAMIDNIIINKSFIPELTGEWAGGLIQVNTKDVPSANFFNVQVGTGFNSQTVGHDFYTYKGGRLDWLGMDDGTRNLPDALPTKSKLSSFDQAQKTEYGKQFENIWSSDKNTSNYFPVLNTNFQVNGGFNKRFKNNYKLGAIFAATYSQSNKRTEFRNRLYSIQNNIASLNFDYDNNKYSKDVLWGALANLTLQLGANNKISSKTMLNVNSSDYVTARTGKDYENNSTLGENIRATELALKSNTFFNTQLTGDHNIAILKAKLHWYGSFNILDQYIPDQRRIQYNQDPTNIDAPYLLLVSASKTSQKSGSRYYGFLNDYIYNAGSDVTKSFNIGDLSQSIKTGYFFQVKDRLFDSRPFAIYLPSDNTALTRLPADKIFSPENFGNGIDNKFAFNELFGDQYRYMANTILNAGFLQFDNQFSKKLRATWGVRVEDYDQVIGSMKQSDPRHIHSRVTDILPGLNLTYKVNDKTNLRLSASQTVIRPEFRELSDFAFFDFDLGATVTGNKTLLRTKVTNADLRYEVYPRAGELITVGVFYKYFKNPIELYFNQSGAGSSSTFNFINADKAKGYGAEFELRKKLDVVDALRNFTLQANVSYIFNRVERDNFQLKRPMQGQSPYVLNASLQYDIPKIGLNTTLLYNQIGDRILYVGGNDYPPVWEATRPLFDLQIAKKLLKNKAEIKLNASDILNQAANYYHDLNDNKKYDKSSDALAIKRRYGSNFNISFAYNIK